MGPNNNNLHNNLWKINFFKFFYSFSIIGGLLIPFFTDWGHLNFTQIFFLQAWFMLMVFFFEVPTGAVADVFGRKHSLALGAILAALGSALYVLTPNFYVFIAAETVMAAAIALISGADQAIVYDTLKKTKKEKQSKKIFARYDSVGLSGVLIGPPLGSLLAPLLGIRGAYSLMVIPYTVAFFIALTLIEPKISVVRKRPAYFVTLKKGLKFLKTHSALKILAFDFVSIGILAHLIIWLYQAMLMKVDVPLVYFGFIHAAFVLGQITVINNYRGLEKLMGSKKSLIFTSSLIMGTMYMLAGLSNSVWLIILAIVIGGGFGIGRRPLMRSYMNKFIPSQERATVLSSINMFRSLGLAVVYPLVGFLTDWSLNYTLLILGVVAIGLAIASKIEEDHLVD